MEKPEQTEQPPPKRIIIIGGGVAGLSLALGIRQMSQLHSLNLQPVIYEATTTYTDRGQHLLLWKWAVEGLLDLGLGKRLGCISWPIVKFSSRDAASREELVRWPSLAAAANPSSAAFPSLFRKAPNTGTGTGATTGTGTGTTTGSTTTTTATGAGILGSTFSSHSGRVPYSDKEKDMDPEAGVHVTTDMPALDDHAYLPPLLGLRKPDLLRMIMTALAGHDDLVGGNELAVKGANNNDYAYYLQARRASSNKATSPTSPQSATGPSQDIPKGIHGDLAHANWFIDEGFDVNVPDLHMGHELESYMISSSTGQVSVSFTNGATDSGFMLIGADGLYSKVRDLMHSSRVNAQHSGSAILTGICRTYMPPADVPTEFEDGTPIPVLSSNALLKFCPDGSSYSYVDHGLSFGVANIGNGFLGWNMVASQQSQGQIIGDYVRSRRRRQVGSVIASMSMGAGALAGMTVDGIHLNPSISSSSVDEWMVPSGRNSSMELPLIPLQDSESHLASSDGTEIPTQAENHEPEEPAAERVAIDEGSSEISHPVIMVHTPNTPIKRTLPDSIEASKDIDSQGSMSAAHSRIVNLPDFEDTAYISGEESRALALSLLMKRPLLPVEVATLVARTDTRFTAAFDNMDLGEIVPTSYTSNRFHPGRVLLIGDAAHGVATAAHGSIGASLAIADAVVLCKLLGHYLRRDESLISQSSAAAEPADPSSVMNPTMASTAVAAATTLSDAIYTGSQAVESVIGPMLVEPSDSSPAPVQDGSEMSSDSLRLKIIATKYMALRLPVGNACCYDTRAEVTWRRQEEGLWKNLVKMSVGYTWARSTYQQMLVRGAPVMSSVGDDDDAVVWPHLSRTYDR